MNGYGFDHSFGKWPALRFPDGKLRVPPRRPKGLDDYCQWANSWLQDTPVKVEHDGRSVSIVPRLVVLA